MAQPTPLPRSRKIGRKVLDQAKNTLDKLGAAYTWHNIEEEEGAADRAVAISGQMHIPVVRYDDGSFQVEPSAVDIRNKLQELGV